MRKRKTKKPVGRPPLLTEIDVMKAEALFTAGICLTVSSAAMHLGVSTSVLARTLERHGVKSPLAKQRAESAAFIDRALRERAQGGV